MLILVGRVRLLRFVIIIRMAAVVLFRAGGECTQETLVSFAGRMDVNRNKSRILIEFNRL